MSYTNHTYKQIDCRKWRWYTMNRFFCGRNRLLKGTGCAVLFFTAFFYCYLKTSIPDRICIGSEQAGILNFAVPFPATLQVDTEEVVLTGASGGTAEQIQVSLDQPFSIYSEKDGSYHMQMKLFGFWNYKDIQIKVLSETEVIPGGSTIGIYLEADGVLVIGTSAITDERGELVNPCGELLRSGDYIIGINGKDIFSKEELIDQVGSCKGTPMTLNLRRKQKKLDVQVTPVSVGNDQYRLGIWVRDDTQGIGTLTYMTKDGAFGALGHGISDADVGELLEIQGGQLYPSRIHEILKGSVGKPGSLAGTICYGAGECLGTIQENTQYGIFGQLDPAKQQEMGGYLLPVAYRQEVKTGPATIRCCIDHTVQEYEVEITHINQGFYSRNKDMVIQVTDPRLLEQTGGIVQGMSGSPILQEGKIVGAVTHVFVNDPTKGYGIFIETMLE